MGRVIACVIVAAVGFAAFGQPERGGERSPREMRERQPDEGMIGRRVEEEIRRRLDAIVDDRARLDREEERLREALRKLESGERFEREEIAAFLRDRAERRREDGQQGEGRLGARGGQPLSEERADEIVLAIRELHAPTGELLDELRSDNADMFKRFIPRLAGRVSEIERLEAEGLSDRAEMKRSEFRAGLAFMHAARQLGAARRLGDEDAIATSRAMLREAVELGVDARLDAARQEAEKLERRLGEMRAEIERSEARRDALIDEQIERVMRSEGRPSRGP